VPAACAAGVAAFGFSCCALKVEDSLVLAEPFAFDFAEIWLTGKRSPDPHNRQQIQIFLGVITIASSQHI
jgi:hypothetical protein